MTEFLIYGANGYTGSLIARLARERGYRPVLAGRNAAAIGEQMSILGLPGLAFDLGNPTHLDAALSSVRLVLHCAGPFAHTARPMAEACIRRGVHYLDVTGEIAVFETLAAMGARAAERGVMLLPGVGFDVVPTDCLAAHLQRRLPTATHLTLAMQMLGRTSRGTAKTMAENVHKGGAIRRDGQIVRVPACWRTRTIDLGKGPTVCMTIPWGDVSTAFYTTGIPNIEVYLAAPWQLRTFARASRYLGWLLGSRWVQRWMKRKIDAGPVGPSEEQRQRGVSLLWGQVRDSQGATATARLRGPEGYTFTALTALAIVERVLAGQVQPGFRTPAGVYGADLVRAVPGVVLEG